MQRLDTLIGRIFQKAQRILPPKSAHRLLTTFLGSYDDVLLNQPSNSSDEMEVRSPLFPPYWADNEGAWDEESGNVLWDEAQWDE